jgi:hypothetical protein
MAKLKNFLNELSEMLADGYTIAQVADFTGLPQDVVFDMAQRYSLMEPEPTTLQ